MSNPEIAIEDAELAALMSELEAENDKIVAEAASATVAEPAKAQPEPQPEPELKPKPDPKAQPREESLEDLEAAIAEIKIEEAVAAGNPGIGAAKPVDEPVKPVRSEPAKAASVAKPNEDHQIDMGSTDDSEIISFTAGSSDVPHQAKAKLRYGIDVDEFKRETKLTEATLDTCMIEQAGLRAFYGAQAANAEAQHARLKARFEVLEAKLYDESRKSLAASGEKTTEKMVENAVKLNPRWIAGKNAVIEAETIAMINKSLVASLADRRDMMIQLGADRREEYKGAARILAEKEASSSLKDRATAAFPGRNSSH